MKEITMVVTCEITVIDRFSDEQAEDIVNHKADLDKELSEIIKSDLDADHVNILKNQLFIRDIPNQSTEVVETP